MSVYKKVTSKEGARLNSIVLSGFLSHYQSDDVQKTHLFEGRYENIYLTAKHIPTLKTLINEAIECVQDILQKNNIRAGFWFNFMPPGAITLVHNHNDDDELLSAVYYVDVPEHSGNLVIYDDSIHSHSNKIEITPKAGEFIFFKSDICHEVTRNNSEKSRLSIGINFGQG